MKKVVLLATALALTLPALAQLSRSDVFKGEVPVTFLGLDFRKTKFIGNASQYKDAGDVTNNAMKERFIPAWNEMLMNPNEQKSFRVADAVNRTEVTFDVAPVEKVNSTISNKDFFSDNVADIPKLSESQIQDLLKAYDFGKRDGIGLILFVEGMRKGEEKGDPSYAKVVVAFVDMANKNLLMAKRLEGKAGGFGFRNFWAGAWKSIFKQMKSDWKSWKRTENHNTLPYFQCPQYFG